MPLKRAPPHLFNPVDLTTPKWRDFKHPTLMKKLHLLLWAMKLCLLIDLRRMNKFSQIFFVKYKRV